MTTETFTETISLSSTDVYHFVKLKGGRVERFWVKVGLLSNVAHFSYRLRVKSKLEIAAFEGHY